MRVHVDRLDLLAANHDGPAARLAAMRIRQQAATAEYRAGGHGSRAAFQKMTACVHGNLPQSFCGGRGLPPPRNGCCARKSLDGSPDYGSRVRDANPGKKPDSKTPMANMGGSGD
jgi:hypothetical protein